jgi:excinuclease ABC subunit A
MPDILIQNARTHNLAGASCRIPQGSLTAITGVSGSGKSSLAFDTLYAEGQRRYVSSLSAYARQFLERLPRPDVDFISNLPPAIAIERRNRVTNARSTVGTATEILDYLRLLFAHAGETICPDCGTRVETGGVEAVAGRILERYAGDRIALGTPSVRLRGERTAALRERLVREGYSRLLDEEGRVVDVSEVGTRALGALSRHGLLLLDRLVPQGREEERGRVAEGVAAAFARGAHCVVVDGEGRRRSFRDAFACDACGREFAEPVPALFSFNSPLGACPTCQGFGRVPGLDPERVLPDPRRTLAEGAVAPFATPSGRRAQRRLLAACEEARVPVDVPVECLPAAQRDWILRGDGKSWHGVRGFFARLERKRYKVQARVLIARYRRFDPCGDCGGARLRAESLAVRVAGRDIAELSSLTLADLGRWLDALALPAHLSERVARLRADLRRRVATAVDAGLDYVTLERTMRTLSGGEAQRIQLATALSGALTASLYVLDEPSIGLHARDVARLVGILRRIRDRGNTVVVVEHAPEVIGAADHVIDIGPGAGRRGGRVVVEGDVESIRRCEASATGRALASAPEPRPREPRAARGWLRIVGAREHNLRNVTVRIPLGQLVVFSGVSGAGKTTLVRSVLVGQLRRDPDRGACERVEGAEDLADVVMVEPQPPARSPRSNPATVSKAFEGIRRRFAATREARARGLAPGWFSFNVRGGRCDVCEGAGEVVVDMQFLDDVRVPCDLCAGTRYRPEALEIRVSGRNIVDVLSLTVGDARRVFADDPKIAGRLEPLERVGLGYLELGQPLSTLSGGEIQRLRIAQALAEGADRALYVLDEPTTGLHPADIQVLLGCLDDLLDAGASVLVVEHNLDVIRCADFVVDLGPEGGPGGGHVVCAGPPETIARSPSSHTGAALRALG